MNLDKWLKNLFPSKRSMNPTELENLKKRRYNQRNYFLNEFFDILIIIVVIVVCFCSYLFAIKPKYQQIVVKIASNSAEENQIYPKYRELKNLRDLVGLYKSLDPILIERLKSMVPPLESDTEAMKRKTFTELYFLLSKNGFQINDLKVAAASETLSTDSLYVRKTATTTATTKVSTPPAPSGFLGMNLITPKTAEAVVVPEISLPSGVERLNIAVKVVNCDYIGMKKILALLENSLRLIDIQKVTYDPSRASVVLEMSAYYLK